MAIDAGHTAVGMVRVEANDFTAIGKALDAGAVGVIVPLVNNAAGCRRRGAAAKYPPLGGRSYGPCARRCGSARCRPRPTPPPWSSP